MNTDEQLRELKSDLKDLNRQYQTDFKEHDKQLKADFKELDKQFQTIRIRLLAALSLAGILGIAGVFGASMFINAKKELNKLSNEANTLRDSLTVIKNDVSSYMETSLRQEIELLKTDLSSYNDSLQESNKLPTLEEELNKVKLLDSIMFNRLDSLKGEFRNKVDNSLLVEFQNLALANDSIRKELAEVGTPDYSSGWVKVVPGEKGTTLNHGLNRIPRRVSVWVTDERIIAGRAVNKVQLANNIWGFKAEGTEFKKGRGVLITNITNNSLEIRPGNWSLFDSYLGDRLSNDPDVDRSERINIKSGHILVMAWR